MGKRPKQLAMFRDASGRKIPPPNIEIGKRHAWDGYAFFPGTGPEGRRCEHCWFLDKEVCLKAIELRTAGPLSEQSETRKAQQRRMRANAGTVLRSAAACKFFRESAT